MSPSWNFPARAELSQAELGHFNFGVETELTILTMSKNCKFFTNFPILLRIMILINFMINYLNLYGTKGVSRVE